MGWNGVLSDERRINCSDERSRRMMMNSMILIDLGIHSHTAEQYRMPFPVQSEVEYEQISFPQFSMLNSLKKKSGRVLLLLNVHTFPLSQPTYRKFHCQMKKMMTKKQRTTTSSLFLQYRSFPIHTQMHSSPQEMVPISSPIEHDVQNEWSNGQRNVHFKPLRLASCLACDDYSK